MDEITFFIIRLSSALIFHVQKKNIKPIRIGIELNMKLM